MANLSKSRRPPGEPSLGAQRQMERRRQVRGLLLLALAVLLLSLFREGIRAQLAPGWWHLW